jgi:hypothetical protein
MLADDAVKRGGPGFGEVVGKIHGGGPRTLAELAASMRANGQREKGGLSRGFPRGGTPRGIAYRRAWFAQGARAIR